MSIYFWIVFCGWVRNGFKQGLEFWPSVFSPVIVVALFFLFTVLGVCSGGVTAFANVFLPVLGIYFLLPIPNWHPLSNFVREFRSAGQ